VRKLLWFGWKIIYPITIQAVLKNKTKTHKKGGENGKGSFK
jgi:hypothetical protein